MGDKWPVDLACDSDSRVNRSVLLHAADLRHGTELLDFPSEGRNAVDFFARKI
jgi:hypothetical protein